MWNFRLFALLILGLGLYRDSKKDPGLNVKAKRYHAILLCLFFLSYAGSFGILGWLVRNFDKAVTRFGVDVGMVPGNVHLIFFFLHLGVSLAALVFAYQMITRNKQARRRFVKLVPLLGMLSVFNFYRGWLSTPDELILSDWTIIAIAMIVMGGITFVYWKVYSSDWMDSFFNFQSEQLTGSLDEENDMPEANKTKTN